MDMMMRAMGFRLVGAEENDLASAYVLHGLRGLDLPKLTAEHRAQGIALLAEGLPEDARARVMAALGEPQPEPEPEPEPEAAKPIKAAEKPKSLDRNEAIKAIRQALKARSGKLWSVTGGRGTGWGWIHISAPPSRRVEFGYMTEDDRDELTALLGLDRKVGPQGENVPASADHRAEFVARARGEEPTVRGEQYWD